MIQYYFGVFRSDDMEMIIEFKDIVFGYRKDLTYNFIIKYQDGNSSISYPQASMGANERVIKFIEYKGELYALVSDSTAGKSRLLKLETVIEGGNDNWVELYGITTLTSEVQVIEYFEDSLVLFSTTAAWEYKAGALVDMGLTIPVYVDKFYSSLYFKDRVYFKINEDVTNDRLISFDGAVFESLDTHKAEAFPVEFYPIGKKLLAESGGMLYYGTLNGSDDEVLEEYDVENAVVSKEYDMDGKQLTCIYVDKGIIFCAHYNTVSTGSNICTFVPKPYFKEAPLVAGEGRVLGSLLRVDSDPVFTVSEVSLNRISYFRESPVVAVLQGLLDPVIKYGPRLEFYTDLWELGGEGDIGLKTIMDMICELTDNFFKVNGNNVGIVSRRGIVGSTEAMLDVKQDSDYGNSMIKSIISIEPYSHNFRRVLVNWVNKHWGENNPAVVGANDIGDLVTVETGGFLVNDPILAKNIALNMIDNMNASDVLKVALSLAYYLETGDVLRFESLEDASVWLTKDREWKVLGCEHNKANGETMLTCLERVLIEERERA